MCACVCVLGPHVYTYGCAPVTAPFVHTRVQCAQHSSARTHYSYKGSHFAQPCTTTVSRRLTHSRLSVRVHAPTTQQGVKIRISYEVVVQCNVWGAQPLLVTVPFVLSDPIDMEGMSVFVGG